MGGGGGTEFSLSLIMVLDKIQTWNVFLPDPYPPPPLKMIAPYENYDQPVQRRYCWIYMYLFTRLQQQLAKISKGHHEKTGFLPWRKQWRRSASQ